MIYDTGSSSSSSSTAGGSSVGSSAGSPKDGNAPVASSGKDCVSDRDLFFIRGVSFTFKDGSMPYLEETGCKINLKTYFVIAYCNNYQVF